MRFDFCEFLILLRQLCSCHYYYYYVLMYCTKWAGGNKCSSWLNVALFGQSWLSGSVNLLILSLLILSLELLHSCSVRVTFFTSALFSRHCEILFLFFSELNLQFQQVCVTELIKKLDNRFCAHFWYSFLCSLCCS